MVQVDPFQCSATACWALPRPNAQQSAAARQMTSLRKPPNELPAACADAPAGDTRSRAPARAAANATARRRDGSPACRQVTDRAVELVLADRLGQRLVLDLAAPGELAEHRQRHRLPVHVEEPAGGRPG